MPGAQIFAHGKFRGALIHTEENLILRAAAAHERIEFSVEVRHAAFQRAPERERRSVRAFRCIWSAQMPPQPERRDRMQHDTERGDAERDDG